LKGHFFIFGTSEIISLAKESMLKDDEVESFLNYFDSPEQWMHVLLETFHDEEACAKTNTCIFCGKEFETVENLYDHKRDVHPT